MATIQVYHEEENRFYQVSVTINSTVLDMVPGGSVSDAEIDYYLKITTTIRREDGTAFPQYVVRSLADAAPGYGAATTFTELVNDYVAYFIVQAGLGQSSSSSSSSSNSSSSVSSESSSSISSESSSSKSSSSSSSSSSSEQYSSSSSSSSSSPL